MNKSHENEKNLTVTGIETSFLKYMVSGACGINKKNYIINETKT